jgi:hypothetical protein
MEGRLQRGLARTTNRSHALWRVAALAALACVGALGAAAPALASVTIGQLPNGAASINCTGSGSGFDYLQPSVTGGNLYVAREAGKITSWSTNSSGSGATYVLKVFRRTTDPDSFQVVAHAPKQTLSSGLNTFSVGLTVRSGDMLGFHESGMPNSCTFSAPGDNVINRAGDLADGAAGTFGPQNDVRLNLQAVLVPDNGFTLSGITRDRKRGTATITVQVSNPGLVTVSGKGLKKGHAAKTLAVAGPVTFPVAATGRTKRRLLRKGHVTVPVNVTFFPTGGDPSTQAIGVRLRKIRPPAPISPP